MSKDGVLILCPKCRNSDSYRVKVHYVVNFTTDIKYVKVYTGDWLDGQVYDNDDEQVTDSALRHPETVTIGFDWDYRMNNHEQDKEITAVVQLWCGNCDYIFPDHQVRSMGMQDIT